MLALHLHLQGLPSASADVAPPGPNTGWDVSGSDSASDAASSAWGSEDGLAPQARHSMLHNPRLVCGLVVWRCRGFCVPNPGCRHANAEKSWASSGQLRGLLCCGWCAWW